MLINQLGWYVQKSVSVVRKCLISARSCLDWVNIDHSNFSSQSSFLPPTCGISWRKYVSRTKHLKIRTQSICQMQIYYLHLDDYSISIYKNWNLHSIFVCLRQQTYIFLDIYKKQRVTLNSSASVRFHCKHWGFAYFLNLIIKLSWSLAALHISSCFISGKRCE